MLDVRFYEALGPVTVRALAPSADIGGNADQPLNGVAPAAAAGAGDLCYYDAKGGAILASAPGACILPQTMAHLAPKAAALIFDANPRAAFARLSARLARPRVLEGEARIDPSAQLEKDVKLGPGVVIGAGVQIGEGAEIGANAVIGPGVAIGRHTRIGANAVIGFALIGDAVSILSGAVIGESGFGAAPAPGGPVDMPHWGRVIIQDRVTIGANSAVDRGMFEDTLIGEGAKIDNLCHIAHNVQIGRGVLMAAFGGISGTTKLGDGVMMGGRVGVSDHRLVGEGAVLAAGSAVLQDVPAGETWAGYPAKPIRRWLRETAWLGRKATGARDGKD
jgi:UDP-3-O-[3-hydroxymyristoyl] glucosamine N-acyltransferase